MQLRALGGIPLGLPVVVARAKKFVTIGTWWNTKAFSATLHAKEHAFVGFSSLRAPLCTSSWAFCWISQPNQIIRVKNFIRGLIGRNE